MLNAPQNSKLQIQKDNYTDPPVNISSSVDHSSTVIPLAKFSSHLEYINGTPKNQVSPLKPSQSQRELNNDTAPI